MIASGLVFELGVLSHDSHVMMAAFTLSAGLLGVCEAAFWTTIVELGTPRGGLAAGLMNMGGNAGGLLSPMATPLSERDVWQSRFLVSRSAGVREPGCAREPFPCVRAAPCGWVSNRERMRSDHVTSARGPEKRVAGETWGKQ